MESNKIYFSEKVRVELIEILTKELCVKSDDADTLSHALMDINEALESVYSKLLPDMFIENDPKKRLEIFWKISEEFRHIQYHIDDAKLTELLYIPKQ